MNEERKKESERQNTFVLALELNWVYRIRPRFFLLLPINRDRIKSPVSEHSFLITDESQSPSHGWKGEVEERKNVPVQMKSGLDGGEMREERRRVRQGKASPLPPHPSPSHHLLL